jgi:hypothetical protein
MCLAKQGAMTKAFDSMKKVLTLLVLLLCGFVIMFLLIESNRLGRELDASMIQVSFLMQVEQGRIPIEGAIQRLQPVRQHRQTPVKRLHVYTDLASKPFIFDVVRNPPDQEHRFNFDYREPAQERGEKQLNENQ